MRVVWAQLADISAAVAERAGELWQLADSDLLGVLAAQQVALARQDAARLAVIRELDARGVAAARSFTSSEAMLGNDLNMDRSRATADVRAARQLDPLGDVPAPPGAVVSPRAGEVSLAATGRALLAGRVSRAHADAVLASVRNLPQVASVVEQGELLAKAESLMLGECARLSPGRVRRCGEHIRHYVDPDGVLVDERDAVARSTFSIKPEGVGYRFTGFTDAVTGAQLVTLIDARAKPCPQVDPHTGVMEPDPRLPDTRRGHAFADLVRLAANADETVSGGTSTQLVVTMSLETLQAQVSERGTAPAETENGRALSGATARRIACDSSVIPVVLGANGEPLDVGRSTRTIPTGIRRALTVRDKHCAFPGCDRPPRWADAHHVRHWVDGGPTSMNNLVLVCGLHHDVLHHTAWTVAIGDDGLPIFTPPAASGSRFGRPPPRVA